MSGDHPGIGTKNLDQREKAHRQQKGQQAGQPKLLYAICHDVLLRSGGLNLSAQISPILDLAQAALSGVLYCQSSPAQSFEGVVEVGGELFDDLGALVGLESESVEPAANERLPIRHGPPS